MEITVKNFGPINNAKIDVSQLTIIIGKNNLGKSYLSQLIHVFQTLSRRERITFFDLDHRLRRYSRFRLNRNTIELIQTTLQSPKKEENKLFEAAELIMKTNLETINEYYGNEMKSLLEETYGLDISELININSEECQIECKYTKNATLKIKINYEEYKFNIEVNEKHTINAIYNSLKQISSKYEKNKQLRLDYIEVMYDVVENIIFGKHRKQSIYIPAGRAGLLESIDIVSQALMQLTTVAPIRGLSIPPLSGTTSQFYSLWIGLRGTIGNFGAITNKFTNILDGEIRLIRPEKTSLRSIVYVIKKKDKEMALNIIHTASMVKELTPIYLLIQELGDKENTFIIEEPESHLHPGNQIKLMNIFAELINNGLNIVFTTHSDIILRKISNLLGSSYIKDSEVLNILPSNTSLYFLSDTDEGSCLNKIKTSETGILTELPTFDDVIKILYEEETKIQQKI